MIFAVFAGMDRKRIIKSLLLFIWQLPQEITGLIFMHVLSLSGHLNVFQKNEKAVLYYCPVRGWKGALTLGRHIFFFSAPSPGLYQHEFGHVIQSRYLGWLYLPLIALPSLVWAGLFRMGLKKLVRYDWFIVEKSATRLGEGHAGNYHHLFSKKGIE